MQCSVFRSESWFVTGTSVDILFDPRFLSFKYFPVYTATNMFGEIGGYLGLLMGYSCLTVVDILDAVDSVWRGLHGFLWSSY